MTFTLFLRSKQIMNLTISKTTNLDSSKVKKFEDENFKFDENDGKCRKHCGKRRNCLLRAIFPVPTEQAFSSFPIVFLKDLCCRQIKTRACLGRA